MEAQQKAHTKRKFVREVFFPLLCESTESITDADIFLQSFSSMIMESFLSWMKEKKFIDLDLTKKLDPKSPLFPQIEKLVNLFNEMSIREAQDMVDGMKDEIRFFFKEEMKTRKLDSLKTKWLE